MSKSNETQQQPTETKPIAEMTAAEVAMEGRKLAASYLEKRSYFILERN
ncbi:MAG: YraN family protein [Atopobiaceae bacterium]|jgi:hypothetical protein|nr:YraN family protein [Atopobiaceae bacterium]